MAKQVWKINDWSGGLSDSPEIGIKNSFSWGQGLDIHSEPRVLKVLQKLTKKSGTTVTDLVKTSIACSDGNTYLFGDGGKIYKRTSAGVYSLVYTDANGAILGSGEHNGYLYWATASKLSRKPIPGASDWSDIVHDWKTLTADSNYHPMTVCWEELYIGCANDLASVDISGTFTSSALDLPPEERIRCLNPASSYIVLHTWKGNTINEGRIFTWDSLGLSYLTISETLETGIRASLFLKNFLYIWAGISGNFYYFDSSQLQLLKRLPGVYSSSIFGEVFPEAVTVRQSAVLFGMSAGSGAASKLGVYGWGQYNKNYPLVLSYDYPISTGTTTSIKIGIVKQIGNVTLVSWKDGSSYGVDEIDEAAKQTMGIYESVIFDNETPFQKKRFTKFTLKHRKLPADCSITLKYRADYNSSWTTIGTSSTENSIIAHLSKVFEAYNLQLRIELNTNANVSPELISAFAEFSDVPYTYRV